MLKSDAEEITTLDLSSLEYGAIQKDKGGNDGLGFIASGTL